MSLARRGIFNLNNKIYFICVESGKTPMIPYRVITLPILTCPFSITSLMMLKPL